MRMSGFVEAHIHTLVGSVISNDIDLQFDTREETLEALPAYRDQSADTELIRGPGWRYTAFPDTGPGKEDLDEIWPDKPAILSRAFEGRETRMIVAAALIGGLAPFCSCQVIPFIAGLLALGAPLSAVMAFWLSSPLIDPPTLLITAGALGWPFAIGKALAAVGLGLFGGFVTRGLMRRGAFASPLKAYQRKGCGCGPKLDGTPHWRFWTEAPRRAQFRAEFGHNALFLIKWLTLAYVLEALLVHYVPAELIAGVVGGTGVVPIATAALVGMPAYLNSYVAPPLLSGLIAQGMSNGAAMAFMVAGAVSSIPAMAAGWALVQPRVFALYLGLGVTGAILAGVLFQMV
jgi:uncharacterized membrane protein YraQ (UPF0718 family)